MDIMYAAVDSRNVSILYILSFYGMGWMLKLVQQSLAAKWNDSTIIKNKEKIWPKLIFKYTNIYQKHLTKTSQTNYFESQTKVAHSHI